MKGKSSAQIVSTKS